MLRAADVPDDRIGGMSRTMYCTGDELVRAGHHVDYLFHESFTWKVPRQVWRYARTWEALSIIRRRWRAGERWDVIEMHEPLALAYGLARTRDRSLPPLVIFSYGIEARSYAAMRQYRADKGIRFRFRSRITSRALVAQAELALRCADHVICSSREDAEYVVAHSGLSASRVTLHHSGVEQPFLDAGSEPRAPGRRGLLFVGSWIERKGILDLVPAVARVLAERAEVNFTVAGCNCPADNVKKEFPDALRSRVRVIPRMTSTEELVGVYRDHSILVLPSYFEGQPLVMIEAAALGLAIVTTPICGMRDFIDAGVHGLFCPVGDRERLADAMLELVANPHLAERMGERARQRAQEHTWRAAAAKIEAAYYDALAWNVHEGPAGTVKTGARQS